MLTISVCRSYNGNGLPVRMPRTHSQAHKTNRRALNGRFSKYSSNSRTMNFTTAALLPNKQNSSKSVML